MTDCKDCSNGPSTFLVLENHVTIHDGLTAEKLPITSACASKEAFLLNSRPPGDGADLRSTLMDGQREVELPPQHLTVVHLHRQRPTGRCARQIARRGWLGSAHWRLHDCLQQHLERSNQWKIGSYVLYFCKGFSQAIQWLSSLLLRARNAANSIARVIMVRLPRCRDFIQLRQIIRLAYQSFYHLGVKCPIVKVSGFTWTSGMSARGTEHCSVAASSRPWISSKFLCNTHSSLSACSPCKEMLTEQSDRCLNATCIGYMPKLTPLTGTYLDQKRHMGETDSAAPATVAPGQVVAGNVAVLQHPPRTDGLLCCILQIAVRRSVLCLRPWMHFAIISLTAPLNAMQPFNDSKSLPEPDAIAAK